MSPKTTLVDIDSSIEEFNLCTWPETPIQNRIIYEQERCILVTSKIYRIKPIEGWVDQTNKQLGCANQKQRRQNNRDDKKSPTFPN